MSDHQVVETHSGNDPSIESAIESAVAEAQKESGSETSVFPEPETEQETTTEEAPDEGTEEKAEAETEAATEEKPEEKAAEEPEEDDLGLSAEQLDLIQKDPSLLAVYKSMQRGMTKKAQTIAATRKELEEKARIADFIRSDPDKALELLAEQRGRRIAPREEEAKREEAIKEGTDELLTEWAEKLGGKQQAEIFYPLLQKSFEKFYQKAIGPIQELQQKQLQTTQAQEYAAGVAQFEATVKERGEDYGPDIEKSMSEKMKFLLPAEGATLQQYLGDVYDAVMMDRSRVNSKKSALRRLREAETKDETVIPARTPRGEKQSVTADMSDDDAIALAVKQAEAGQY